MLQVAHQLLRTGGVDAVPKHLPGHLLHRLPARGAHLRRLNDHFLAGAQLDHRTNHVGDHIARTLDQHAVADADVLLGDVVEVVQRGLAHDHPTDLNRIEHGVGGEHAGAPHVDARVAHDGGHLARREFERQRAARVFPYHAQVGRQAQVVDLDHHAVGLEGQRFAQVVPFLQRGEHRIEIGAELGQGADRKAKRAQVFQQLPLGAERQAALGGHHGVAEQRQRARGGEGRVQLAQRPGGSVARVEVERLAGLDQPLVEGYEIADVHKDFAAHGQVGRRLRTVGVERDAHGHGADRAQVGGDIFTHHAVAAGGALRKAPVAVVQHHRQAVDLGLQHKTGVRHALIHAQQPVVPGAHPVQVEGVAQAEDGGRVAHLLEFLRYHRPGALGGRIGRDPLGVFGLDLAQPEHQPVVLGVTDQRLVEHVVAVVVKMNFTAQFFQFQLQGLIVHSKNYTPSAASRIGFLRFFRYCAVARENIRFLRFFSISFCWAGAGCGGLAAHGSPRVEFLPA